MVKIEIKDQDKVEKALKKFHRKVFEAEIIFELQKRKAHAKPSVKRKEKKKMSDKRRHRAKMKQLRKEKNAKI